MTGLTIRKKALGFLLALNLVVLPAVYFLGRPNFLYGRPPAPPASSLPILAQLPDFKLMSQDGSAFTEKKMKSSVWLADFIFTRCPNQCPMMSAKFSSLQNVLPPEVRLASFTVDPEYDTVEKLNSYAANYKAEPDRWVFLTGEPAVVRQILAALHLGDGRDPGMHSLRFVLLDKSLRVRAYYDSQDTRFLAQIKADIKKLEKES